VAYKISKESLGRKIQFLGAEKVEFDSNKIRITFNCELPKKGVDNINKTFLLALDLLLCLLKIFEFHIVEVNCILLEIKYKFAPVDFKRVVKDIKRKVKSVEEIKIDDKNIFVSFRKGILSEVEIGLINLLMYTLQEIVASSHFEDLKLNPLKIIGKNEIVFEVSHKKDIS